MKQCKKCMAYLSDYEAALCEYTELLCIVHMPDEQAAALNSEAAK